MDRARLTPARSLLPLVAVVLVLPLAACTGDDDGTPPTVTVTATVPPDGGDGGSAEPSPTSSAATPDVTESPAQADPIPDADPPSDLPFVADTEPDVGTATSPALVTPTDLRYGRHDGYDRVVIDLAGTGTPGWRAACVASPVGQASGEVVDVDGAAYLDMLVQDVAYPGEEGQPPYEGPAAIVTPPGGIVREVRFGGVFEGTMQITLGLDSAAPFRVYVLTGPTRLVIDVQQP